MKLKEILKRAIMEKLLNEEPNDNLAKAKLAFQPYLPLLSKFKPGKIQDNSGSDRDCFMIDLNVPGQFENPALLIEFQTAEPQGHASEFPINTVGINVWFKPQTNKTKYKQAILELMQILASKNPKMPVLLYEDELSGTVKKWANMKQIESMY